MAESVWRRSRGDWPEDSLNGESYTVIGVLPAASASDWAWAEIWIPLTIPPNAARGYHYLLAAARLKSSVSVAQAQAEMSAIAGRIAEIYPAVKKGWGAVLDHALVQPTRNTLVDVFYRGALQLGGMQASRQRLILAPDPLLIHQQAEPFQEAQLIVRRQRAGGVLIVADRSRAAGSCSCVFRASSMPSSRMAVTFFRHWFSQHVGPH